VFALYDQADGQELELVLPVGVPQEVFFGGLKAVLTVDNFRGSHGVAFRVAAGLQHQILRSELLKK
jgi:hypothetical protein